MAHKNRRSPPPRRWSPEPRHSFKPAKETISPRDFGFVAVRRRRLVSFAWCPLPPRSLAGGSPLFAGFARRFTHWRVHVAMAFFASRVVDGGDPPMIHYASRGRLVCVIREFGNGRGVVAKFARMRCTSRERLVMERFQRSAKN